MLEKEFTEFGVHKSIAPSIINCHGLYELPRALAIATGFINCHGLYELPQASARG